MSVTHGADVEQLEGIAAQLREQGQRLETVTRRGGSMMDLLKGEWSGADLDGFTGQWGVGEEALRRAMAAIEACSLQLQRQADQQEASSAGSSFSPGAGASMSLPPFVPTLPSGPGVDPTTIGRCPTVNRPSCDELTQEELDRIEREQQIDEDAPIVLETEDGKINAAEAAVMAWFLLTGGREKVESMMDIKREADGAGAEAYPGQGRDQQEDAFRHAYWNARMTQEHGEGDAKSLADAHEKHADPTPLDDKREAMDLHNNEVGRRIGKEHPDATPEQLKRYIDQAVRCGEMVCIDEDGNLRPSNYNL